MSNPADEHVAELIEELAKKATRVTTSAEESQIYINQIAQLRASMNPVIHQHQVH
jgi:hypothetical protein